METEDGIEDPYGFYHLNDGSETYYDPDGWLLDSDGCDECGGCYEDDGIEFIYTPGVIEEPVII